MAILWLLSVVVIGALVLLAPTAQAAGPVELRAADQAGVRSYWTPERMRAAEPVPEPEAGSRPVTGPGSSPRGTPTAVEAAAPGEAVAAQLEPTTLAAGGGAEANASAIDREEIGDPSAPAFRMHGKVFLTIEGGSVPGDYVCSGTALNSNNGSTVWTAGHCVYDTEGGGFATNWVFVPGYRNGSTPYGEWPAARLATTSQWKQGGNLSYDLGAAEVTTNGAGQALNDVVGGRGIAFNQQRSNTYQAFGYPAVQPPVEFTGGREFRCTSGLEGTDNPPGSGPNTNYIACDMTGGSSGGGWIVSGTVLGVISYSYCTAILCEDSLYGPYQDGVAQSLYTSIAGAGGAGNDGGDQFCEGEPVTHLGTPGDDRLVGTDGPDVFKARKGDDEVIGKGGNDMVCAGPGNDLVKGKNGKDTLKGQGGDDTLKGQKGKDALRGGGAIDGCNGGKGKDSRKSCEFWKRIP